MKLYLHDNTPAAVGEKHGERGPTHMGTIHDLDYEYQAEQWVIDLEKDDLAIVRIECPSLGCEWRRINNKFERFSI